MSAGAASPRFCVLLACFADRSGATEARRRLDPLIRADGAEILDEVVLRVDGRHRARVHDPGRTWAGFLTAALTWGIFGLLTGGWASLGLWAVLGALCGGVWAYLTEHLLTTDQLGRIGASLPPDSSALTVYAQVSDPRLLLARAIALQPTKASVAAIAADFSAQVLVDGPETGAARSGRGDRLAMILARYPGRNAARTALPRGEYAGQEPRRGRSHRVEVIIETDGEGRHRVVDPATGARAMGRSDLVSWGGFGLVLGVAAGWLSNSGILGSVESGVLAAVGYGLFGLVAGSLYGLWAGRSTSAERIRQMGPLLPPDTSTVIAWADDGVTPAETGRWAAGSSCLLMVWFVPSAAGATLATQAEEEFRG